MSGAAAGLEIERVFLLRGMPPLPNPEEILRIEQGYFDADAGAIAGVGAEEGRVRRTVDREGRRRHLLTRKRGSGLVREEVEREIDDATFDRLWDATGRRRIEKVRHRIPEADLVWEVDRFEAPPIVLAEVELPSADHPVSIPAWLEGWIVREVTEDPAYRNSSIAFRLANGRGE
jgi:adenylate cyclase